jgi:hypothetical protein
MVAQDHRGAMRSLLTYAAAPFDVLDLLRPTVAGRTADTLTLSSGVCLAAYPCRPAALRGLRACVAVADELAFFRNSEGDPVDTEMLRALRPCLATTGGKLIILSSPYGQSGALWDLHRKHYRRDDADTVLIWQASAPDMNPTLSANYLARMAQDDPEAYRSEVLGEFRAGLSQLFDPEAVADCVAEGVRERPPRRTASSSASAIPRAADAIASPWPWPIARATAPCSTWSGPGPRRSTPRGWWPRPPRCCRRIG